jgi:hypothetical protein
LDFLDVNVLSDDELREEIKKFSYWPTIPQIYIKGEFIGGCDIVKTIEETGELKDLLLNFLFIRLKFLYFMVKVVLSHFKVSNITNLSCLFIWLYRAYSTLFRLIL